MKIKNILFKLQDQGWQRASDGPKSPDGAWARPGLDIWAQARNGPFKNLNFWFFFRKQQRNNNDI